MGACNELGLLRFREFLLLEAPGLVGLVVWQILQWHSCQVRPMALQQDQLQLAVRFKEEVVL